ncbi:MAG: glutamyl-tRNA reductase [Syntrophomonadaceae bacterium]|jgi:glutamyl-tRNA reductase
MYVLLAGLNHRTASISIRERFVFNKVTLNTAYDYFINHAEIEGTVILATCNRTEIYATARDIQTGIEVLKDFLSCYSGMTYQELKQFIYLPNCYDAISHLFRVAAGLDSMILGEAQILGQVKEAYLAAVEAGASSKVLNSLFQRAIYIGKKVQTETRINQQLLSVPFAAVQLARKVLGGLQGKTVMVIGAGEMGELTVRSLLDNGVQTVIVSNRSYARAISMAQAFNGRAVRFDQLALELEQADIVISCTTASHYVIREDNCGQTLKSRNDRRIIMIDIAVPRDIDPVLKDNEGVYIYDIDDLQNVVDANLQEKQKSIRRAEHIIAAEIKVFNEWMKSLYVVPVITALKAKAEEIKQNEIKRAFNRLGKLSEQEEKVISSMANSIINQILHQPMVNLKDSASSNQGHVYAEVVKKLFGLQIEIEELENYETPGIGKQGQ